MLAQNQLFHNLAGNEISDIEAISVTKKFKKNEIIYLQEDEAKYIYLIKNGWVKLFAETIDGEEAIIDVLPKGHIFGDHAIMEGSTSSHSAETIEDSEIIMIPISKIRELFGQSPKFAMNLLEMLTLKQKFKDREVEHLSLQNAPQRIGCFLLRLCKPDDLNNIHINLPYDKSLIASRLGMKAETFSRALSRLKTEAGISVSGSRVNISSITRLSTYCCNACSNSFPCEDVKANAVG